MRAKLVKRRMVVDLPLLKEFRDSKSGKSKLVATTRGIRKASFIVAGKPVYIVASAFIRNDPPAEETTARPHNQRPKIRQRKVD